MAKKRPLSPAAGPLATAVKPAAEWIDVSSTNVRRIKYEKAVSILTVEFLNGSMYEYIDVDGVTASKVIQGVATAQDGHAHSVGAALDQFVKKRNFRYRKIA